MPLNNAVLDFHPLGVIDTPAGPRQRVVLVAAQRDMVERLLGAIEQAGLIPVGIDLSAFALIRSLYAPEPHAPDGEGREGSPRVLYLNVDGLTNLAIAEGPVCRFTRVVGGGIESMAAELAAKREITTPEARALLFAANLAEAAESRRMGSGPPPPQPVAEMTAGRARRRGAGPGWTRGRARRRSVRPPRVPGRAGRGQPELPSCSPATPSRRPIPRAAGGRLRRRRTMSYEAAYAEDAYGGGASTRRRRGRLRGARERHPRHLRRGPQLARLPPLPGRRRGGLPRRPERRGPGHPRLRGRASVRARHRGQAA